MNFLIHNGSRGRANRTLRASQPVHGGHKQYVLKNELRLVRGRPLTVSEEVLKEHLAELREKFAQGLVYVTTLEGRPVDLETLSVGDVAPESPAPNPPLDSAANDKASGIPMASLPGDLPPPKEFEMPVAPPAAAVDNPIEGVVEAGEAASEEPAAEGSEAPAAEETPAEAQPHKGGKRRGNR